MRHDKTLELNEPLTTGVRQVCLTSQILFSLKLGFQVNAIRQERIIKNIRGGKPERNDHYLHTMCLLAKENI